MLVSVVIPTYNPGRYLDAGIASLMAQTLPSDQFEVVIVDDGSTDGTPAHLEALATEHSNIRVVLTEHSGWAGRPRNVGIHHARGEFIQFMDQDDRLAPDALRRLVATGRRNHSDVVLGKSTSDFRGVALSVFARNRDACTIYDSPVINSLTPHKMFRRAFIEQHGLAFPEGRRRLEDQPFVLKAYFAAAVISIVADAPCYFYLGRDDRGNAGSTRMEPVGYYENVREVIDILLANTEPGKDRDRLMRRFARVELLNRLSGPYYVRWPSEFRQAVYENVRSVYLDVVPESAEADLGAVGRLRARLLRDDRPDALLELATRMLDLRAVTRVESAHWTDGRLLIAFTARIEFADGSPVELIRRSGRTLLDPRLTDEVVDLPLDVTDAVGSVRVGVVLHERTTHVEWAVPSKVALARLDGGGDPDGASPMPLALRGEIGIDPQTVAVGRPLAPGEWDIRLRVAAFGLDVAIGLGCDPDPDDAVQAVPPLFHAPGRLVSLRRSNAHGTELAVEAVDGLPVGIEVYRPPRPGAVARLRRSIVPGAWRLYDRLPPRARRRTAAIVRRLRVLAKG